jgi:multidrug transporter EmrE-like cation transporter
MAWFNLVMAGIFEICWAVALKYTDLQTRAERYQGPGMIMGFYFLHKR